MATRFRLGDLRCQSLTAEPPPDTWN